MSRTDRRAGQPVMLALRLHARLATFAVLLLVFAVLPFLGTSAQGEQPRQALLLSAEASTGVSAPAAIQGVANGVATSARLSSELGASAAGLMIAGVATAAVHGQTTPSEGGGLVLFPALDMAPMTFQGFGLPEASFEAFGSRVAFFQAFGSSVTGRAGFIRPVVGTESSGFGPRIHPLLGRAMFHTGIDLMAACGTPVRAAAAGTIEYAETSASWGNRIIIAHSPTLKTAYGHLSKFIAHEGDVVAQGQLIGLVGTTGWSTGCHLHWDVIIDGHYVDPAPYLGLAGSSATTIPFRGSGTRSSWTQPASTIERTTVSPAPVPDGDVPIPAETPKGTKSSSTNTGKGTSTTTGKSPSTTTGKSPSTTTGKSPSTTSTTTPPTATTGTTTPPPTTPPTTTPPPTTPPTTTTTPPTTTTSPPTTTTSPPTTTTSPPATPPATTKTPPSTSTGTPCPTDTASPTSPAELPSTGAEPACPTTDTAGDPADNTDAQGTKTDDPSAVKPSAAMVETASETSTSSA